MWFLHSDFFIFGDFDIAVEFVFLNTCTVGLKFKFNGQKNYNRIICDNTVHNFVPHVLPSEFNLKVLILITPTSDFDPSWKNSGIIHRHD